MTSEFFRAFEMDGDELKDHYEELEDDFLVRAMADTGDDGMRHASIPLGCSRCLHFSSSAE